MNTYQTGQKKVLSKKNLPSLYIHHGSFEERVERLVQDMEKKVAEKKRINLSVPPHVETTFALHRIVHSSGTISQLRIEYSDGSLGKPFPVHLPGQPSDGWGPWEPKPDRHLNIGTLSLRHVDYDRFVDVYLLRDKETRRLNQGDVDALAYQEMGRLLRAEQLRGEFYITIFQAGLEPLAVGLYRALVEHLMFRSKNEGFGPIRIASIFGLEKKQVPEPKIIWGNGAINE